MSEFKFKTQPFSHQLEEFEFSRDLPVRAVLWEQGTGKTKLALDTACWLHSRGEIDALLVVAPNGVHDAWVRDEIPAHCSTKRVAHAWSTRRASTRRHACEFETVLTSTDKSTLKILAMSYDGLMTPRGAPAVRAFLDAHRCMYVLDESHRIKTPGIKRTKRVIASGRRAPYRRILSGTPVPNKPFDVYSQMKFLDEEFWVKNGFASYESFKTYFGIWEQRISGQSGHRFMHAVGFRNLKRLNQILSTVSSRVTKDQVLDLPPKLYAKAYFDLSSNQRTTYDLVRRDFLAVLDSGRTVTATLAITNLLRLQQITCGYVATDDANAIHEFVDQPRLNTLREVLEDVEGSALIFSRFRRDVDKICETLGDSCVRYDGTCDHEERSEAVRKFQAGEVRFLVGNPAACGEGLTLHAAATVIYYSNSFNLKDRLQSEDRAHRIGQRSAVRYVDIVAKDTVDERIVAALRDKRDVASEVTGDAIREWI